MDFTREPIIEAIITPKEGYKLVIRSSKSVGQEEYFVDAVEIASFGRALFFRSLERPKAFLVPVSDYEVVEVREARMVLKNAVLDRSIKIGGGRDALPKAGREAEKEGPAVEEEEGIASGVSSALAEACAETRVDKKRDRRRHYRKRKGRDEAGKDEPTESLLSSGKGEVLSSDEEEAVRSDSPQELPLPAPPLSALLQPPPTLISDTINRYRQNELFRGAFYLKEEEQYKPHDKVQEILNEEEDDGLTPSLREPTFEREKGEEGAEEGAASSDSAEPESSVDPDLSSMVPEEEAPSPFFEP